MLTAALMILPLGLMMGMPLPLGIEKIREHSSAVIPWAWGMSGLFTVVGGLLSVSLSITFGFNQAIICICRCIQDLSSHRSYCVNDQRYHCGLKKGDESWEIARSDKTNVKGKLKVGAKVMIKYRMTATRIEVK